MTMEEATELFGIMQGMLQTSEAARAALLRAAPTAAAPLVPHPPPVARPPPSGGSSDDLFLVGLLAIGAGAGLLAAMTKRIQEGPAPPGTAAKPTSGARDSSQQG